MSWKVSVHGNYWQASCRGRMMVGDKQQIESFLDCQDNLRREQAMHRVRMRRAKRRLAKLLNWLYNHKK